MNQGLYKGNPLVQLDGSNNALNPVVYGNIALSINTQYNVLVEMSEDLQICNYICVNVAFTQ